jgi:4-hydroxybenzoate polyprenyltransferase
MAYLSLTRPLNLFFVVLAQVLCAVYILDLSIDYRLVLFFVGSALITAAGYVINDYFDVKADAVNKPSKVYVGRQVSRRKALLFVFTLNFITICLTFVGNLKFIYIYSFIAIFGLWLYSYILKRTFLIGNLLISCLAGFSIYILSYLSESNNLLLAFSLFAFITNLIREIIKDAEDIKGDLLLNAKTLPIVLGENKTKIVISILCVIFLAFLWMAFSNYANMKLIASVLIINVLTGYVLYTLWTAVNNRIAFKQSSQTLKIIMLVGCLSIPLL